MTDPARLGVYIHWPYCAHICPYCDFNVYRPKGDADALVGAILEDLQAWARRAGDRTLTSIHFGGGTPSLLSAAQITQVIEACDKLWGVAGTEIGLEANPNDADRFSEFAAAGINRLSLGVQSFEDEVLERLGRDHDGSRAADALDQALAQFDQVSVDLIYAWAGQTLDAWAAELERAMASGVGHVSPYQLTIEAKTAFGKRAARGEKLALEPDDAADFLELTESLTQAAGFDGYEISNHARSEQAQSRHNRLYWDGDDWVGVGPGAHGRLGAHATGGRFMTQAERRPADYIRAVQERGDGVIGWDRLSALDEAAERILMGMRVSSGLDRARLRTATGHDIDLAGAGRMEELGLIEEADDRIWLTPQGRALADGVSGELVPAGD